MKVATLNYGPFQAALVGPLAPDHWPRRLTCISPKKKFDFRGAGMYEHGL
jgi:hypothetical protein